MDRTAELEAELEKKTEWYWKELDRASRTISDIETRAILAEQKLDDIREVVFLDLKRDDASKLARVRQILLTPPKLKKRGVIRELLLKPLRV